ncbi:hypothetical protein NNX28_04090 [Arthrobacter sp. zg-Y859]|uniref:Uncharacterized protein n=1 Tax=Arthrobacter jinronghuae TaxID=2964609 RepID=A0ABT1NN82_9MICC|nr:hypothetical protein [Arthrobacter jinronghuae]MCQ1949110.1 hypothetical protein [Arthrobacter jinronghuae]MCQ1955447.1 hypothetical protein [Arthrobacter jinronghuae]UWX78100.1 hypothetical protein N2K98_14175 [Arthrobacter jinronghuae]
MAREERLLKLGERFIVAVAVGDQEQIWEAAEKKIQALRAIADADTSRAEAGKGWVRLVPAEAINPREHSVAGTSRYKLLSTLNPVYPLEG